MTMVFQKQSIIITKYIFLVIHDRNMYIQDQYKKLAFFIFVYIMVSLYPYFVKKDINVFLLLVVVTPLRYFIYIS